MKDKCFLTATYPNEDHTCPYTWHYTKPSIHPRARYCNDTLERIDTVHFPSAYTETGPGLGFSIPALILPHCYTILQSRKSSFHKEWRTHHLQIIQAHSSSPKRDTIKFSSHQPSTNFLPQNFQSSHMLPSACVTQSSIQKEWHNKLLRIHSMSETPSLHATIYPTKFISHKCPNSHHKNHPCCLTKHRKQPQNTSNLRI